VTGRQVRNREGQTGRQAGRQGEAGRQAGGNSRTGGIRQGRARLATGMKKYFASIKTTNETEEPILTGKSNVWKKERKKMHCLSLND